MAFSPKGRHSAKYNIYCVYTQLENISVIDPPPHLSLPPPPPPPTLTEYIMLSSSILRNEASYIHVFGTSVKMQRLIIFNLWKILLQYSIPRYCMEESLIQGSYSWIGGTTHYFWRYLLPHLHSQTLICHSVHSHCYFIQYK